MNYPLTNPFLTPMTDQIITTRKVLDREFVTGLIGDFYGTDAEIEAFCDYEGMRTFWVRVSGWWEDTQSYERFWVWLTNDVCEYDLCWSAAGKPAYI